MKMWRVVPFVLALAPSAALAQSEFAGHWKFDESSAKLPAKPEVILLQNGVYSCSSCVPAFELPADGKAHPVSPTPYRDAMAMTVIDDHTVHGVRLKGGVVTGRSVETVSPDGSTYTFKYEDLTVPASPVTGQVVYTRLAPGPGGSHPLSGQWRQAALSGTSENGLYSDVAIKGSTYSYSTPSGQSYTAQLDGAPVPYVGDPGITTVAIAHGGPHTLVETDYRNGAVIAVEHMNVSPDGHTLTVVSDDKLRGTTSTFTLLKQ